MNLKKRKARKRAMKKVKLMKKLYINSSICDKLMIKNTNNKLIDLKIKNNKNTINNNNYLKFIFNLKKKLFFDLINLRQVLVGD